MTGAEHKSRFFKTLGYTCVTMLIIIALDFMTVQRLPWWWVGLALPLIYVAVVCSHPSNHDPKWSPAPGFSEKRTEDVSVTDSVK